MPFTTTLANAMLNHTYTNSAYTRPTTWWVQLHYGNPGTLGTSNVFTSASRIQVADWTESTSGQLSNVSAISWVNIPSPDTNDTMTHFSVFSESYSGTFYASGQFATSRKVEVGDVFTIGAGELVISIT